MKIAELLQEESLQAAVKRLLKPGGTIAKVMGDDAAEVAKMLEAKVTDNCLVLRGDSPISKRFLEVLQNSRGHGEPVRGEGSRLKVVRMPGGAKVVVVGPGADEFAITSEYQKDRLVEAKSPYSKKRQEQEQIDPTVVKKVQKKAPKIAKDKAKMVSSTRAV